MPKNERGEPLGFFNIHSVAKHQKLKEDPLGKNFFLEKKVSQCRNKTESGDSLDSPGMACYAEKEEDPFWISSLGRMIQFGTINFRRTFVELVWSVRVEKKRKKETL